MTLFLFSGLNYFNRKIVHYDTIHEYQQNLLLDEIIPGINFIPNDGITTSQVINHTTASFANGTAISSYLIVCDDTERIISRWWITENVYVRQGQSRLSLLRDVISDYYNFVIKSPAFIKKGYIGSVNDPAIYNNESLTFNQIKTKEYPIKDRSGCGWYVGYIDKTAGGETITIADPELKIDGEYDSLDDYPYATYTDASTPFITEYADLTIRLNSFSSANNHTVVIGWGANGAAKMPKLNIDEYLTTRQQPPLSFGTAISTTAYGARGFQSAESFLYGQLINSFSQGTDWQTLSYPVVNFKTGAEFAELMNQEGKIIKIGTDIFKVKLSELTVTKLVDVDNTNTFAQGVKNVAVQANSVYNQATEGKMNLFDFNNVSQNWASIEYTAVGYQIVLEPQAASNIEFTLPTSRSHCIDAPYDLIAVPAQELLYKNANGNYFYTNNSLSRNVIDKLITTLSTKAYDWQLLPYCPFPDNVFSIKYDESFKPHWMLETDKLAESAFTEVGAGLTRTVVLYPNYSNFNKVDNSVVFYAPEDPIDFKVANECDMYRLCSPNYNGQFEFSAAKNGGVKLWNISCSYKPFSPYIRVSPLFDRLYGGNFEDARGLICGGDFSITQTSDAWTNYEINNKNFQVMFDRQIQNMEVNNSVQRTLEKWNIATGSLQGATTGALAGSMIGGPWGAVAGGAIGGAASLAGGAADRTLNEKLRAEAIDYARDQYGYQLQNIKALPDSLTKVGAATNDYKYFPFVEVYTCSEVEKQALRDKIKWNGMTVMRIGTVENFLKQDEHVYIQAQLIRLERVQEGITQYMIQEDSHVLEAISAELNTGVYII